MLASYALVMRNTAVEALRDLLEPAGEILPLATDDGIPLFVFNARVVDALDEARSVVMRYSDSRQIMRIRTVAFVEGSVRDRVIFRLPHRATSTYVSELFVDRVRSAGLRGLVFNQVWSSTPTPGP